MKFQKIGTISEDGWKLDGIFYGRAVQKEKYVELWRPPVSEISVSNESDVTKLKKIRAILRSIEHRSRQKLLPCDLTFEYLVSIAPDICPAFGTPLNWGQPKRKTGGPDLDSPSVDRIVPSLGYVEGNVAWISLKANSIKNSANAEELQAVATWLANIERENEKN